MEDSFPGLIWSAASFLAALTHEDKESSMALPRTTELPTMNQRRKIYPKERWQALKPTIELLYVNESQTFTKVAEYLAEHHDFHPTKKQFMRRISEWGFEKNVKRNERRAILEKLGANAHAAEFPVTMLRGRKLDKAKIERWRKREGLSGGGCETGLTHPFGISKETSSLGTGNYSLSSEMELCGRDETAEDLQLCGEMLELRPVTQQLNFNPWVLVDVVGSPRLTRLIGALTVDLCEDIPNLDLTAPHSEENEDDYDPIALDEGRSNTILHNGFRHPSLTPKTTFASASSSIAALSTYLSKQSQGWTPGPLDKLDPFPTSVQPRRLFLRPKTDHLVSSHSLKMKELECKRKFHKLKSMERSEIIDLIDDIRNVAWRYWELNRFRQAEIWWRQQITSYLKISGHQPGQVLHTCLLVITSLLLQGRPNEALSLHQALHPKILKLFGPDHKLALNSKEKLAGLMGTLGDVDSEIAIYRELLQHNLLHLGPRSRQTLGILRNLGMALKICGKYHEAEALIRLAVELDCEVNNCTDSDILDVEISFTTMSALASSLIGQRRYEEAKNVLNTAERLFKDTVNIENFSCWGHFIERSKILKKEGRVVESEEILRAVLRHAPDYPAAELKATVELAEILRETGQLAEAGTWWKKAFAMSLEMYGIENRWSIYFCERMGLCYADQGRYHDAILHFQQTIEKLTLIDEGDLDSRHRNIERLQWWISRFKQMKDRQRCLSSENSSIEGSTLKDPCIEEGSIEEESIEDRRTGN